MGHPAPVAEKYSAGIANHLGLKPRSGHLGTDATLHNRFITVGPAGRRAVDYRCGGDTHFARHAAPNGLLVARRARIWAGLFCLDLEPYRGLLRYIARRQVYSAHQRAYYASRIPTGPRFLRRSAISRQT